MQIPIATTPNDATEFLDNISTLSGRVAELYSPKFIFSIRVDRWFGFKWRGFSGKALGLIGTWSNRNTLPPFVPNRIEGQRKFRSPDYSEVDAGEPLHRKIPSVAAHSRVMREVAPDSAVIWYSGDTKSSKRGSAMVYITSGEDYLEFYAEWKDKDGWKLSRVNGLSRAEFSSLMGSTTEI
jgi:hypothetical protein